MSLSDKINKHIETITYPMKDHNNRVFEAVKVSDLKELLELVKKEYQKEVTKIATAKSTNKH